VAIYGIQRGAFSHRGVGGETNISRGVSKEIGFKRREGFSSLSLSWGRHIYVGRETRL